MYQRHSDDWHATIFAKNVWIEEKLKAREKMMAMKRKRKICEKWNRREEMSLYKYSKKSEPT